MATWAEALKQIDRPTLTNRDASGLIAFVRAVYRTYSRQPNIALSPWDWYPFALPALGWLKPGDRFKVDTAWQLQPYAFTKELHGSLATIASELDKAPVPFKLLTDPRGTDKGYRQLALDAWAAMKSLGQEASKLPGEQPPAALVETWAAHVGPIAAATAASSATAAAAAAAAPKKTPTPTTSEPEQLPLPGVPQVLPPGKKPDEPTYEAQPVIDRSGSSGGGGGILLLLAALAFGRKKKRKG